GFDTTQRRKGSVPLPGVVSSPLKKPPGDGTGPTIHADFRGNLVGRVPSRGEQDVFERAVRGGLTSKRHVHFHKSWFLNSAKSYHQQQPNKHYGVVPSFGKFSHETH